MLFLQFPSGFACDNASRLKCSSDRICSVIWVKVPSDLLKHCASRFVEQVVANLWLDRFIPCGGFALFLQFSRVSD